MKIATKRMIAATTVMTLAGAMVTNLAACSAVKRMRSACRGKCSAKVASACTAKCAAKTVKVQPKCTAKCSGKK